MISKLSESKMQVLCTANTGAVLSAKYLALGNTLRSEFHLHIDREYPVLAIAVYNGAALFLLADDDNLPNWYPVDLFSILTPRVPSDWFGTAYSGNEAGLQLLLGYERLISDESHYDALLERDPEAIKYFLQIAARAQRSEDATENDFA